MRMSVLCKHKKKWCPSQPDFCPGNMKITGSIDSKDEITLSLVGWTSFLKSIIFGVWILNRYLLSQTHLPPESLKCIGGQRTNLFIFLEQEWAWWMKNYIQHIPAGLYFDPLIVSLEGFPGIDISIGVWHHINHNRSSPDDQCRFVGGFKTSQILSIFELSNKNPEKTMWCFFFREVFEKWFASIFQDAVLPCFSLQVWHEPDAVELSTAIPTTVHSRWREWRCLTNGFDVLKFRPCRFPRPHSWNKSDNYFWAVFLLLSKKPMKGWDFKALTNYIFPKDSPPLRG